MTEMKYDDFKTAPGFAVFIAEGVEEAKSHSEFIAAWQYLHDSGLAYRLQGWFGRRGQDMIREGLINAWFANAMDQAGITPHTH